MTIHSYACPLAVGYQGWIEFMGRVVAFINLDKSLLFVDELL